MAHQHTHNRTQQKVTSRRDTCIFLSPFFILIAIHTHTETQRKRWRTEHGIFYKQIFDIIFHPTCDAINLHGSQRRKNCSSDACNYFAHPTTGHHKVMCFIPGVCGAPLSNNCTRDGTIYRIAVGRETLGILENRNKRTRGRTREADLTRSKFVQQLRLS